MIKVNAHSNFRQLQTITGKNGVLRYPEAANGGVL